MEPNMHDSRSGLTFHPFEIAVCGFSNTGKTTLISRLTALLKERYAIGYFKHGCHRFDIDHEGKDSAVIRKAGASTVMISDPHQHALIADGPPDPLKVQSALDHLDMLLVEGLKEIPLPKIILAGPDEKILDLMQQGIVSNVKAIVVVDHTMQDRYRTFGLPVFHRDNISALAAFIEGYFLSRIERHPLYGLVLAGGISSRMKQDKALLTYHESNQLVHTAKLLLKHCQRVFISCRHDQQKEYSSFGFPLIIDRYIDIGPMAGLLSAQHHHPATPWLVAACDLPLLDHKSVGRLASGRVPWKSATAFRHESTGKTEPLCAIYEPKSRLKLLEMHARGSNSLKSFLRNAPVHYLSLTDPECLQNINDPVDKAAAEQLLATNPRNANDETPLCH